MQTQVLETQHPGPEQVLVLGQVIINQTQEIIAQELMIQDQILVQNLTRGPLIQNQKRVRALMIHY